MDAQGIPNLPDLTHPNELIQFGGQLFDSVLILTIIVIALGIVLVVINFSTRRYENNNLNLVQEFISRYLNIVRGWQHGILILIILTIGFFFCSTLANRYHYWEQGRIAEVANTVAGERLEQPAPKVRYEVEEPYSYFTQVGDKVIKVDDTRIDNFYLALTSSEIQVNIEQLRNLQNNRDNYAVDFSGFYEITNTLPETKELFFEVSPPYGYFLLQNLQVEQAGKKLTPKNPGNYSFPLTLESGASERLRVAYKAQGAPRWIYDAGGELISNFRLTVNTDFPNADFASGITPTETKSEGKGKTFVWIFEENVSVQNPFGVFTSTAPMRNTGILPRLLLLAPALLLWWLLLLYLSLPLNWRNMAIASGVFFACILTLTYLSRFIDAQLAWLIISLILLGLVWGLGNNPTSSLAAVICTISGAILPVFALLIPYTGLTLSIAGLLSVIWLVIKNWYGLWHEEIRSSNQENVN